MDKKRLRKLADLTEAPSTRNDYIRLILSGVSESDWDAEDIVKQILQFVPDNNLKQLFDEYYSFTVN